MTLDQFRDLLLTVTDKVYRLEAQDDTTGAHIIWQETGRKYLRGDGKIVETIWQIQLDLYTPRDDTTFLSALLNTLEDCDEVAYRDPVTLYEKEPKIIHHIIDCEVI